MFYSTGFLNYHTEFQAFVDINARGLHGGSLPGLVGKVRKPALLEQTVSWISLVRVLYNCVRDEINQLQGYVSAFDKQLVKPVKNHKRILL